MTSHKSDKTYLLPNLNNIPIELKKHNQWVVWKGEKIPYNPKAVNSKASVNHENTWATFEQAKTAYEEGGWSGVGFVLIGDGVAGVDLDSCVIDGIPKPEAMQILVNLGAEYIEFSPSKTGLRAFGFAENLNSGVRGELNGQSVELYTSGRYLTVTGRTIKNQPFSNLQGFADLAKKIRSKFTEETNIHACVHSVPSVNKLMDFPVSVIPIGISQRNQKLFQLARWVKGTEPNASRNRQHEIVKEWHSRHLSVIGTKDFETSWREFRFAWNTVKTPYGEILKRCLNQLPPDPEILELTQYGNKAIHLFRICMALQAHHGTDPFFLSCRIAGHHIGCNHTDAAKLLKLFVMEGWLIEIKRGSGLKASRYKLNIGQLVTLPLRGLL